MNKLTDKVLAFLKRGIEKTMWSYDRYTNSEMEEDEKKEKRDFAKHHAACKQAISHLESLLKLYEKNMAPENHKENQGEDKNSGTGNNLRSMMDEACKRIKNDNQKC